MRGPLPETRGGRSDDALIRAVYQQHGQAVLAYATKLTGDRAAAEDVLQETLVRAWRHSEVLVNGKGSVRAWLLTVAGRIAVDRAWVAAARPKEIAESLPSPRWNEIMLIRWSTRWKCSRRCRSFRRSTAR
jgi:RNA polymerase sigma-70 factor (ECF subfamily)